MDLKIVVIVVVALLLGVFLSIARSRGPEAELIIGEGMTNQAALVNTNSGKMAAMPAGSNIHGVGIARGFIYAASFGADEVAVIDPASGQRIGTVTVGGNSHHVAVSPD